LHHIFSDNDCITSNGTGCAQGIRHGITHETDNLGFNLVQPLQADNDAVLNGVSGTTNGLLYAGTALLFCCVCHCPSP
jgi:hypothetical protein